ncbi:Nucleotidyltransferase/DNA polymerase involved in DNA repair [Phenylobacterium zucineum HLK1]|uniref:Nucleotidyltransferase/DNA polymerase involved in DNA repair n=1 Tax=Phenylobacterium zucineum (strain HLK1) TaxID=450851 RepID=B4RAS8_PHEZH|nr:Nucleotidyltransferase/DNA polymerase involved in DNA repair [Phenylobacterium zucineum HLK1]
MRRLAAVSREARALRLYPGQKATDAAAIAPDLVTAEAEPEADAAALAALADWCVRFSPAVAADPPDGLFLDITGVDHLFGGEAGMMAELRERLLANGLPFRLAIADTPGAAWALARHGRDGTIAPPGGQADLLAPLPPAALRLLPEDAAQIERLGLRRIGQLLDIPRAPLGRRFGARTLTRLDQALGRHAEALTFRRPPTPWVDRLAFFEPISAPEDMARVTWDVCARLCARLEAEGQGARRFEVGFCRVDGKIAPVEVGLALPGRDARRIARLFAPKVEAVDPGFGIDAVLVAAYEVEPLAGRQAGLETRLETRLETGLETGLPPAPEDGLAPLVDRLANRLGPERVWRAAPVESHVPELSVRRAAPLAAAAAPSAVPAPAPWDPEAPRPARLFRRPEPLDGVIALTPDDPPSQFRWRGRLHRVRRAEGPERVGEEWWKRGIEEASTAHVRDYYRVEDQDGARFWLFRAGLYEPGQPAKWWLHGLFG